MNIDDFNSSLTSQKLRENISRQFGVNVNLTKYNREQLEDMRNKLRTNMFQVENAAGINDLLNNESYQKNKAMLELLNLRIKEMLGEDIKKLKDKLQQIDEAKKGVRAPKKVKKARGAKAAKDYDGDGKIESPKDEVWGSRAKAAAKSGKPFQEAAKSCCCKEEGKSACPVHGKVEEATKTPSTWTDKSGKTHPATKVKGKKYTGKEAEKETKSTKESVVDEATKTPSTWTDKSGKKHPATKVKGKSYTGKEAEKKEKPAKESIKESFRQHVRVVNEGLARFIAEDEEEKAKAITAASDMANDFTSWMTRIGQYQTKAMIELADEIRHEFGAEKAEQFKQAVAPALSTTLDTLMQQREVIGRAVATLAGAAEPMEPMGMEPEMGPPEAPMEPTGPDMMNEPGQDEFAASDAAAGAGSTGRELRESVMEKLAESHSIISKLAK